MSLFCFVRSFWGVFVFLLWMECFVGKKRFWWLWFISACHYVVPPPYIPFCFGKLCRMPFCFLWDLVVCLSRWGFCFEKHLLLWLFFSRIEHMRSLIRYQVSLRVYLEADILVIRQHKNDNTEIVPLKIHPSLQTRTIHPISSPNSLSLSLSVCTPLPPTNKPKTSPQEPTGI